MSTDGAPASTTQAAVLKRYFGLLPEQTLAGFTAELKQLDPKDKKELAVAAAKELGLTLKD
jgi:hypothetical protein